MRMRARGPVHRDRPARRDLLASEVERVRAPSARRAGAPPTSCTPARRRADRPRVIARGGRSASSSTTARGICRPRPRAAPTERAARAGAQPPPSAERAPRAGAAAALTDAEAWAPRSSSRPGRRRRAARAPPTRSCRAAGGPAGHTFAWGARAAPRPARAARAGERGAPGRQRRRGRAEVPVLAFEETGAYRLLLSAMARTRPSCSASMRRRSSRSSPTTSSTRPIWSIRWRRSSTPTATSPAPPRGCSPTATRSATASSACASCPAWTSAPATVARSSPSGSRRCACSASPVGRSGHRGGGRRRARPAARLAESITRPVGRAPTRQLAPLICDIRPMSGVFLKERESAAERPLSNSGARR